MDITEVTGLSHAEAAEGLKKYGPNVIENTAKKTRLEIIINQFESPLIIFLLVVAAVSFLLNEFADAIIIVLVVIVNAVVGYIQENRSRQAIESLKNLITNRTTVVREGTISQIDSIYLVPGDVIALEPGDKVQADGIVLFEKNLQINESQLTGESFPVDKTEGNHIYMGSFIVGGKGIARLTETGMQTKLGTIADEVSQKISDTTPLEKKIHVLTHKIIAVTVLITGVALVIGLSQGYHFDELIRSFTSLAISIVPEGLPIVVTITLALGVYRMSQSRAIMKNLASVSTLAAVDMICTDKTGTLTEGHIKLAKTLEFGINIAEINKLIVLCNNALASDTGYLGGSIDVVILESLDLSHGDIAELRAKFPRIDEIPFDSDRKYHASLHKHGEKNLLIVKGAVDILMHKSDLSASEMKKLQGDIDDLTNQGYRLIGVFSKETSKHTLAAADIHNLNLKAILCFSDPVREGVLSSMQMVQHSGIDVMIITGDYKTNALAVATKVNMEIEDQNILEGSKFKEVSGHADVDKFQLIYRANPEDKLTIVERLQAQHHIVAMTGDGVNDAPALVKADIGIAMGRDGTDVARESADMVLSDDSFATIVKGIEEARNVFENLRKVIIYLFLTSVGEAITMMGSLFLGLPIPLLGSQMLWLNLTTDGFLDITLATEKKEQGLMQYKPKRYKYSLITNGMWLRIIYLGVFMGAISLGIYVAMIPHYSIEYTRTVILIVLAIVQWGMALNSRSDHASLFKTGFFTNKAVNIAILIELVLLIISVYTPFLQNLLKTVPLKMEAWLIGLGVAVLAICVEETRKLIYRYLVK